MEPAPANRQPRLAISGVAAFCTYFCAYGFRKPFSAATFEELQVYGYGLKAILVLAQLAGYMTAKFIGIKVISEMRQEYRAIAIIGLILFAELALVGFAFVRLPLKAVMLFLNGLPLGLVFGLVMAYLEGRKQTEALSAALCASFIVSSGVAKSTGRWLIEDLGFSEFQMPMAAGAIFLAPLFLSVWLLQTTPPPDGLDRQLRSERKTLNRDQRCEFVSTFWPGLSLLICVYVALTVIRTIRDDFGVEIWRDLGVQKAPSVFTRSETIVALCVTALNAMAIWIRHNLSAIRWTVGLMCVSFGLVAATVLLNSAGMSNPFLFMVASGVGLYVPYVAFHTTIFERLIAASGRPCNLGFLMYLADSMGYLGYATVMVLRTSVQDPGAVFPFFRTALLVSSAGSILALVGAMVYFDRILGRRERELAAQPVGLPCTNLVPAE